ncbi:HlyD family efflux transporter periplasmic adaptor subunit [Teichococcus coralli]|nr:HlyD family efflux transporter periplasmic adaptor subunit [Pseudoroseomonas coralli]
MSTTTAREGLGSPPRRARTAVRRLGRLAKVSGALGILAAGAYAIRTEAGYVATDTAVVSAYLVALRSPVEGQVSGLQADVGTTLPGGAALAEIRNPRLDLSGAEILAAQSARLRGEGAALEAERAGLQRLRATLQARAAGHARLTSRRLASAAEEAERALEATLLRRDRARREAERRSGLAAAGFAPAAELDRLRSEAEEAGREAAAQQLRRDALRQQAEEAAQGVLVESGAGDVAYSAQRMDEVDMRLSALARELLALEARGLEQEARLAAERQRLAQLRRASLALPAAAPLTVWRLGALAGERVAPGDTVAELVDCRAAFLVVHVPQSRLPEVAVGGTARFRLAGETRERAGTVLAAGGAAGISEQKLAVALPPPPLPMTTVRVALPPEAGCLIGRTARVLLPVAEGEPALARLTGWLAALRGWLGSGMAAATRLALAE